jgi:hypothetical protein
MKTLNLTLKRKWFDMILSGEKKEEYREIKPYWASRLLDLNEELEYGVFDEMIEDMINPFKRHNGPDDLMNFFNVSFKDFDAVKFRNGYAKDAPAFTIALKGIEIKKGKESWGAEEGKYYFVLNI